MSAQMNDVNLFRTQYRPLDTNSPEHKAVQQVRQKCDELLKFIDSQVIKGQSHHEVNIIRDKLVEASMWATHFATRDKATEGSNR